MGKRKGSSGEIPRQRRGRLMAKVRKTGASAMLITRPQDVAYLSGFGGEDSWLLVGQRQGCLITDGRFGEQAGDECPGLEVHVRKVGLAAATAEVLKGRGVRSLGVQAGYMTLAERAALDKAVGAKRIKPVGGLVEELRQVKDDEEVRIIRKAVAIAERAFERLTAGGRKGFVGRSERELAAELEYLMRQEGADGPAFATIVAVSAHGSLPHHRPGATRVRGGDAVLIDFGATVDGYCSDLTRVLFVDKIPPKLLEIYEVVRQAQAAAIAAIKAGVSCSSVDEAARDVIEAAGYGPQFVHSLGHGLGREVHEAPRLAKLYRPRLKAGMVVTVEPGIYLPGVGGVRIEDDVLVTRGGCRRLSTLSVQASAMVLE
ncbi:MAG: aminopeptidase P family protein [Planctomycetaceae bacterium]|nr:aminopeptidase P family protein [Planctomycetaceae bacterium]